MFKFSPAISRVFFFKTQYGKLLRIIAIQRERFEQPITDHRQRKYMLDFLLTFYSPVILDFNNKTFTSDFIGEKKISPSDYYFNYILTELKWIIYHQWFLTSLIFLENNQRLCSTLDEAKGSCDVVRVISPPAYAKSFKLLDNYIRVFIEKFRAISRKKFWVAYSNSFL